MPNNALIERILSSAHFMESHLSSSFAVGVAMIRPNGSTHSAETLILNDDKADDSRCYAMPHTKLAELAMIHRHNPASNLIATPFVRWKNKDDLVISEEQRYLLGGIPIKKLAVFLDYEGGIALRAQDGAEMTAIEVSGFTGKQDAGVAYMFGHLLSAHGEGAVIGLDSTRSARRDGGDIVWKVTTKSPEMFQAMLRVVVQVEEEGGISWISSPEEVPWPRHFGFIAARA